MRAADKAAMGQPTLGAASRRMALALTLAALGCSRPLATLAMLEPAAVPSGLRPAATEPSARSRTVVAIAKRHVGVRYAWGGADPAGFDCSGFVLYVYAHLGVSLPHNAAKQYQYGSPVTRERLEPGDVVFFDGLRHNGIYVGDGRFIHARRSGRGVIVSGLDEAWYKDPLGRRAPFLARGVDSRTSRPRNHRASS